MSSIEGAFAGLAARAGKLGVDLDEDQVGALRLHFELLLRANRSLNLTRVTDPEEAVLKLYLSSLSLLPVVAGREPELRTLSPCLDLGTGAGFPGVPLAVAARDLSITLLDSRGRKVAFLRDALAELGLDRVRAVKARGRELCGREPGAAGSFGLITARAVAEVAAVLAEVKDLVRPGGLVVIPKGPSLGAVEVRRGLAAAARYGFKLEEVLEIRVETLSPRIVLLRRATPPS